MDEIIVAYIDSWYNDERKHEIYFTFQLFDKFDLLDKYSSLIDILSQGDLVDSNTMMNQFENEIRKKVNYILKEHTIELKQEATLFQCNQVLYALNQIQDLRDYSEIISVLESMEPDEVMLAEVISQLSELELLEAMDIIDSFDSTIIKKMKEFCYQKEILNDETIEYDQDMVFTLKTYFDIVGENNLGFILIQNQIRLNEPFLSYYPFIENIVTNDDKQTAANILSIILMSLDGKAEPLDMFRKHSENLLHDIKLISRIETHVIDMLNQLKSRKEQLKERDKIISEKPKEV